MTPVPCTPCQGTGKLPTGKLCLMCIGRGTVATNEPGICRQCGERPLWKLKTDRWEPRVCLECGILNLARSFETDLGDNPTLREISNGEQAGAFFRSMLPTETA